MTEWRDRVLILDDDAPIRRAAALMLRAEGLEVVEHDTPEGLLVALERDGAGAVILDLDLARRAGIDLAERIVDDESLDRCAVIGAAFDVAHVDLELVDLAIAKPYVKLDLARVVRAVIATRESERGLERDQERRAACPAPQPS